MKMPPEKAIFIFVHNQIPIIYTEPRFTTNQKTMMISYIKYAEKILLAEPVLSEFKIIACQAF